MRTRTGGKASSGSKSMQYGGGPEAPGINLVAMGRAAREAALSLAKLDSEGRRLAVRALGDALQEGAADVLAANRVDLEAARASDTAAALMDRLMLSEGRIADLADAVRQVADLPDPVGRELEARTLDNGLLLERIAVPLGVVGAIYEARPNVTVDIAALCLKTGNACILRGGSETLQTNVVLAHLLREGLGSQGLPTAAIQLIDRKLDQIRRIADEFPKERLWDRPRPDMVSLGNLICHVAGSMRDWLENGLGQGDWKRDRPNEFQRENGLDRHALVSHLDETRDHCDSFLSTIDAATWNQTRAFRNKSFTVRQIVLQQMEHVAYHAGQAAFLRRIVADLEPTP